VTIAAQRLGLIEEATDRGPVLCGRRRLARRAKTENNAIYVGSLDSQDRTLLLNANSNAVYVPPGYLLYQREGTLMAQPFDAERIRLTGEPVPTAEGL
jgi:hypothetical protein